MVGWYKIEGESKRLDISGVYKIKCGDCDHVYIGQTGRSFKNRCKEDSERPSHIAVHISSLITITTLVFIM